MLRVLCAVLFCLCSFSAASQSAQEMSEHGLKSAYYIYHPDLDRMSVQLIIDKGEAENPFTEGMAHFVEHLAWLNALGLKHGAPSRHANASTTHHATTYWLSGPHGEFGEVLEKLHRVFLPFELEQKFMEDERKIIMREYDYRASENYQYPVYLDLQEAVYGGTEFGRDVLGTPTDIENFSVEIAAKLHASTHRFENASLVILGSLPFAHAQELVRSQFPPGDQIIIKQSGPAVKLKPGRNHKTIPLEKQTDPELVFEKYVAIDPQNFTTQLDLELKILDDILESTRTGGVAKPLRFDDFIARNFDLDLNPVPGYMSLHFYASPDKGVDLDRLLLAFEESFSQIVDAGIPRKTFDKVHKRVLDEYGAKTQREIWLYKRLPYYLAFDEEPPTYDQYLENLGKVTLDQVNAHLQTLSQPGQIEIRYVTPISGSE
jgi:predicted Zn-dependent peptidase